jgi:3-hydroxymyristoyl/3-hydroxydecanoyl-(acyl carrier protein) dehydratase
MIDLEAELKETYKIISAPHIGEKAVSPGDLTRELQLRLFPQEKGSYFHGHFPGLPILPAVAIADMTGYFIEKYFLREKRGLKKLSHFRIKTPVRPGQSLFITLRQEDPEIREFQASWKNETEDSLSADLVLSFY